MASASRSHLTVKSVDIRRLIPWEKNPRMNERAVNPVAKSIKRFGFNVPILCNKGYRIIAGHTRWEAAKKLGLSRVPVVQLNLSRRDEAAFAIADNKTATLADWDNTKLKAILDELHSEDVDLRNTGFSPRELRRLLNVEHARENALSDPPKPPRTKPDTLWRLGRHRLLCGDSRQQTTWVRLLGNTKVDHIFAGPPYFNQREYSHWDDYEAYLRDIDAVMRCCKGALKQGGIIVWNIANGSSTNHAHVIHHGKLLDENSFLFKDMIIWVKSSANYGGGRNRHIKGSSHYLPAPQWEALLVYQNKGRMPKMTPDATRYMAEHHTDVWIVPVVTYQLRRFGHPAVCPVEIPVRTTEAYADADATILDPFGGGGTTLIAAESTGRRAMIIERSPKFCDAIVHRWETLTGKKAQCRNGAHKERDGRC